MKIDIFGRRIFITIVKKKELPFKDTCWNCGGHKFKYKRRINGRQKLVCLECGKIGYKY